MQWTNNTHFGFVADKRPFTWCCWSRLLKCLNLYQMKSAIQCERFFSSIKFNQCDPMIYEYVTVSHQFTLFDRNLSALSTQQRKFHFFFFFLPIEFPMKFIKDEIRVHLSFGFFHWKIYFSRNFVFVGRNEKINLIPANCDGNFHRGFHWCLYICGTLKKPKQFI